MNNKHLVENAFWIWALQEQVAISPRPQTEASPLLSYLKLSTEWKLLHESNRSIFAQIHKSIRFWEKN